MLFSSVVKFESLIVIGVYAATIVAHKLLPKQILTGYCCDNETLEPLTYQLNGVYSLLLLAGLFLLLPIEQGILIYNSYFPLLFCANFVGLSCSLYSLVVGGKEKYARCVTIDQLSSKSKIKVDTSAPNLLTQFYLGCLWNPRVFNIDIKMILYAIGAIMLQLLILSGMQVHRQYNNNEVSNAMSVYVLCFTWFLIEYMYHEYVHLYTYDLFAEKVGFKLIWGCLVFYPFFYCIGIHSLIHTNTDLSVLCAVAIALLFLIGWCITRGANMQKYYYRTQPECKTFLFGLVPQKTIKGSHILCSGWWGAARHFNYFGEIIQGIALALPGFFAGGSWYYKLLPLLYPLYYIVLFVSRQIDDDVVCRTKYGDDVWDAYINKVPYRIVPGIW